VGQLRALAADEAVGPGRGGGGSPEVTVAAGWRGTGKKEAS
jgi:hypothetical protein